MEEIKSPLKAIRAKCLDCCCDNANEVKLCPVDECPLHTFRFGKNPFRKRELTEEQKKLVAERFKEFRKLKNKNKEEEKEIIDNE